MFDDFKTPPAKHATWRFFFWRIMEEMHFDNGLHQFVEGGTVSRCSRSPPFWYHLSPQTLLARHFHLIILIFLAGDPKGRNWSPKSK